jgi:ABC-type lipoprotein release transport system permease subunit
MTKRKSPTATAKFTMTMVVAVAALCVMTIMMGMGNRMQQYQPTTNLAMTVVAKQEDYTTNIETYKAEDNINAMPFFKDIMERPADCPDLMWNSAQSAKL